MPVFYWLRVQRGSVLWDITATGWQLDNVYLMKNFLCYSELVLCWSGVRHTAPKSFMGQECHKKLKAKNNFFPLPLFTSCPPSPYSLRAWKGRERHAKTVRKSNVCKTLGEWAAVSGLVAEFWRISSVIKLHAANVVFDRTVTPVENHSQTFYQL